MSKMKVVMVLLIFFIVSFSGLKAQDKYFNALNKLTAKKEILRHQKFIANFKVRDFRLSPEIDLYKQFIYQEWTAAGWSNTLSERSVIDTAGEAWTWTSEELLYVNGTFTNYEKYVVLTTPLTGENPRILASSSFAWVDGRWVEFSKISYTYSGKLLIEALVELAIEENSFIPIQKYSYVYDSNDLLTSETVSDYDLDWVFSNRKIYSYTDALFLKEVKESNWRNNAWQDSIRTTTEYGIYDLPSEIIEYLYSEGNESYSRKTDYNYNFLVSGQLVLEQEYRWIDNRWKHVIKKHYDYNDLQLLSFLTTEEDNGSGFVFSEKELYSYNDNNRENERITQKYDGSSWNNYSRMLTIYSVSGIDDGSGPLQGFHLYNNYPNPFNPATTISYSIPADSRVVLNVYNAVGELVKTLVDEEQPGGLYRISFSAKDLPSGIYLYSIQAGSKNETRKMILLK